jgi:acyl-CoA thioesterase FadM
VNGLSEAAESAQAEAPTEAPAAAAWSAVDELPYRIVRPFRVRFEEATVEHTVRSAVLLAWAADMAWQHSTLLGFGREWYSERGLFWLVRAIRLDVLRPIHVNQQVLMSTRVWGYRRIAARRHSEVRGDSGELLARLEIDWVMTNDRGMPGRVPREMLAFVAEGAPTFEMLKVILPEVPAGAFEQRLTVRRRDTDPMAHVNNSVYLDYMEEALEAAGGGPLLESVPRSYVIDYVSSAERNEELVGRTWRQGGGWAYRLGRTDGTEIFRGLVTG